MRTLEEINADILVHINAIAALAKEQEAIKPNPIKIRIVPGTDGIVIRTREPRWAGRNQVDIC
jgi:hypothetical protein